MHEQELNSIHQDEKRVAKLNHHQKNNSNQNPTNNINIVLNSFGLFDGGFIDGLDGGYLCSVAGDSERVIVFIGDGPWKKSKL